MAESVIQYELAAEQRLFDAMAIALTDGRETSRGSLYLYGYVIEMVLKAAYFRVIGIDPTAPVPFPLMAGSLGKAKVSGAKLHDLGVLREALVAGVTRTGRILPSQLVADLKTRVERAARAWTVDLRYDGTEVSVADVVQMHEDAHWFLAHREDLLAQPGPLESEA